VQTPNLREKYGIDLQVQGILNSQQASTSAAALLLNERRCASDH